MKKLLLSCLLLSGICANAQFSATEDFNDNTIPGLIFFGPSASLSSTSCSGLSFAQTFTGATGESQGGPSILFADAAGTTPGLNQTNNGEKIDVSVSYRKDAGIAGTFYIITAKYDTAAQNFSLGVVKSILLTAAATSTCATLTAEIPAGTLDAAGKYAIGAYFVRSTGAGGAIYFDDLKVSQQVLAVSENSTTKLSVYPNPFTDVLKISDTKNVKSVSVVDISGRLVKTLAPSAELNLAELKSGLYLVNLTMNDGSVKTVKAIKK